MPCLQAESAAKAAANKERLDRVAGPAPISVAAADATPVGVAALAADRLYRAADLSSLSFRTTAEIEPIDGLVGQQRAADAIGFGARVRKPGFNLFVIGSSEARMQQAVEGALRKAAGERPTPPDWVYVNNFREPHKPIAIGLPAGRSLQFRDAMRELVDDLKTALPAVFESEDYQRRREAIEQGFQAKQGEAFSALRDKAAEKSIVILRTPLGFALAPAPDGKVVPPDEFKMAGSEATRGAKPYRGPGEGSRAHHASDPAMAEGAPGRDAQAQP